MSTEEEFDDSLLEVAVGSLAPGMFVARLDRSWLGTPFLLQGFEIRGQRDIEQLQKYCSYVYIRKRKKPPRIASGKLGSLAASLARLRARDVGATTEDSAHSAARAPKPRQAPFDDAQRRLRAEHRRAREVLDAGRVNVEKLLHSARLGQILDADLAIDTVEVCVNSVLTDPEAMLWMTKIKNENKYTAEHCLNVCILAIAFGRHLGKTQDELQLLGLCGLLHDVGKMQIPTEILDKPGRLTDEEFTVMRRHTVIGKELLEGQLRQAHSVVVEVAHGHHEQPDGNGYPRRLYGGEIAEFARIISLVDAYDAITSNRCYSRERLCSEAQKIIFDNRGTQFDDELALRFIQAIGPYPPGTLVELHNGMAGIVLASRPKYRHLPTVLVLRDGNGSRLDERTVDLSETDSGRLGREFLIKRTLVDGAYGLSVRDHGVALEPVYLLD